MTQLRFRRKEKKYTEVYNTIIFKNKNVELTGLYTTIQACIDLEINTKGTENEFTLSKKTLQHYCGYKDDKFKRIWNELKVAGYLKQYKIKNKDGKFIYEYELLDEPDLTLHHSLIQNEDGSIVPNIPKSKIEKLKKDMDKKPGVENTPMEPEGEKPHSGEKGGYYNNLLNKVSKYVSVANENFALTNKNKEFINSIEDKIDLDLFEEIVVNAKNKNKTFRYVTSTITKAMEKGITTLSAFEDDLNTYKNNKSSRASKKSSVKANSTKQVKTRFHNINQSFEKYTPEELEKLLKENQEDKFKDLNTKDIPAVTTDEITNEVTSITLDEVTNEVHSANVDGLFVPKYDHRLQN
ncbi:MAG: hypothetical protein IJH55_06880 [Romboutsia sp.]|nr:hypothetical protein [Romboutsia sp.]